MRQRRERVGVLAREQKGNYTLLGHEGVNPDRTFTEQKIDTDHYKGDKAFIVKGLTHFDEALQSREVVKAL